MLGVRWYVMCTFLFIKFFNFIIKGIVRICIVFLKKVRALVLYLTYELLQIFKTFNRSMVKDLS